MNIGISFDLKADFESAPREGAPDDLHEEYDSMRTVDAVLRALSSRGHRVTKLGGGRRFLAAMLDAPPELVFNLAEGSGSRSREAHVPAICEMLGVPCTHSDPLTMALTLDKGMAKRIVASAGVPTPPFAVIESERDLQRLDLAYPLFAKPLFEGSSMGIRRNSKLANEDELRARVRALLDGYGEAVLVEEFLTGAEFTVGVLGTAAGAHVIGVMEIVPLKVAQEDFVYSLEIKRSWSVGEEMNYVVPPLRSTEQLAEITGVALGAYRALGCRDVGRVDVRFDRGGRVAFIEVNPLPGVAPGWSDLALLWERLGRSYDDLVLAILDEATQRIGLG